MSLKSVNRSDELNLTVGSTTKTVTNPFLSPKTSAKPSNLKKLCETAAEKGYKSCIWICFSRGSRFFAKDIPIKEEEDGLELHRLRNLCGWWKCVSLRSAVKIHEVKIHAVRTQHNKEIEVMVLPINYASEMADLQRAIEGLSFDTTNCDAGFNENGMFQRCLNGGLCPNFMMNKDGLEPDFFCALERRHELRKDLRNLQYRQPILDFYWNSKGKSDCQQFLKESGLVTQYKYLETCCYLDAAVHYGDIFPGESIPALLLIDGWNISRLLIIIGFSILICLVVTAVATAAGQNLSIGLTAGSYTFGVVAILIATLTLLSAVI